MKTTGTFGYIIGKKKRMMTVEFDADLLWQILVREIYILIKHYGTIELLKETFEKIKVVKSHPKVSDKKKCLLFTKLETDSSDKNNINNISDIANNEWPKCNEWSKCNEWHKLLYYCQGSFINLLEVGCILNQEEGPGYTFLLDFNKKMVIFYKKNLQGNNTELDKATIEEIMAFDEMPSKTYIEIISNMKEQFNEFYKNYQRINAELEKLLILKSNAKKEGAINIEEKVDKLISDMNWELKILHLNRRVFYNRLKELDLIEEE